MGIHGTAKDLWSSDVIQSDSKAVFFILYASWMGSWDAADDFMRATLATPTMGLTCCLAGRPHWYFHHMGLGEPIGYSTRLTQNNSGLYGNQVNKLQRGVHIALMGDPTLRMHPVAPPTDLRAEPAPGGAHLNWHASSDPVVGYHVYRASSAAGPFLRLTTSPLRTNDFTDYTPSLGLFIYMVRAVKLEISPSGSYYNLSQGVFSASIQASPVTPPVIAISLPEAARLQLAWSSTAGVRYTIQYTTDFSAQQWRDLATVIATNSTTIWTEQTPTEAQRYYRLLAD
jgi:hypothetical protein